jgi:hypothetical protein
MEKPLHAFNASPEKVYDKQTNLLTWSVTESGVLNVCLQHGASESYRFTDLHGRTVLQGDLKDGRAMVSELPRTIYTLHLSTAKGIIRKEIDLQ